MPRKKRFTPVSHDFNRDPQVITLRKDFGDWAALAWIECLGIADRNDGIIPGTLDEIARILAPISLQMYIGRAANAARTILERFIDNSWITQGYLTDASRTRQTYDCVQVVNHWKYHRSPEHKKEPSEPNPNLSEPNPNKNKNNAPRAKRESLPWPAEDLWLSELIKSQWFLSHCVGELQDYEWWQSVDKALGGIDRVFIDREFARMSAWFKENPSNRKTARGMPRFIRSWLERAKNKPQGNIYGIRR